MATAVATLPRSGSKGPKKARSARWAGEEIGLKTMAFLLNNLELVIDVIARRFQNNRYSNSQYLYRCFQKYGYPKMDGL